jgi:hypothetical protein
MTNIFANRTTLGPFLTILELMWMTFVLSQTVGWVGNCWPTAKGSKIIPFVLLALGFWASREGGLRASRAGGTMMWLVTILFLLILIAGIKDIQIKWLKPKINSPNPELAAMLLIPALAVRFPQKEKTSPLRWLLCIGIVGLCVSVWSTGVLSLQIAKEETGAFYEMARSLQLPGLAERFESLVSVAMTISWICLIALLLSAIQEMAESCWKTWGRKVGIICALVTGVVFLIGAEVNGWIIVIGNILFWCLVPLLEKIRNEVKKGIDKRTKKC